MKNELTNKSVEKCLASFCTKYLSATVKWQYLFLGIFLIQSAFSFAQAPTLSYSGPFTYTEGTPITPVIPESRGVAAPGYSNWVDLGHFHNYVMDIALDAAGNVFVLDRGSLKKIPVGTVLGGPIITVKKLGAWPSGLALDHAGNIYVALNGGNDILELSPDEKTSIFYNRAGQPTSIALDPAGNLYMASDAFKMIKVYINDNSYVEHWPANLGSGFNRPQGVAVDAYRNVYVSDTYNNVVKMIPVGSNDPVTIGTGFHLPEHIAVDAAGYIYVADYDVWGNGSAIKKMVPGGGDPVIVTPLGSAKGVAIDGKGVLYASSWTTVSKLIPVGGYYLDKSLPQGLRFDEKTGIISGTPVKGSPATTYTITAWNSHGSTSATLNINVPPSSNASLSSLTLNYATLSPAFTGETTKYTVNVGYGVQVIRIKPTTAEPYATVKVNGQIVKSGTYTNSGALGLRLGYNKIVVGVTAEDGMTTQTYTVIVKRALSPNATLAQLHGNAGYINQVFSPTITSYTLNVSYNNTSISFTPEAQDTLAKIKINGVAVASGMLSQVIPLNEGSNIVTTVVTAPDGVTTKTYTIDVVRAGSSFANLVVMHPDMGSITPSFLPTITSYTGAVFSTTSSFTIAVATNDPLATIKVNGEVVASGSSSQSIPLAYGDNTINILVTAPDGLTTQTYTLVLNRPGQVVPSADAAYQPVGVELNLDKALLADDGLVVHQGISPNGDGMNDFLTIENIANYPDNKLSVMNRNGQLIFESKGYDNSSKVFDGHSNKTGQMQLPGTYFYQLDYTVDGIIKHKTGYLVIKY